jgi:hypothetical protein
MNMLPPLTIPMGITAKAYHILLVSLYQPLVLLHFCPVEFLYFARAASVPLSDAVDPLTS